MKNKSAMHPAYQQRHFQALPAAIPSTLAALFAEGLALHQAGRLDDAERIYNRILAIRPDHFDSQHLLGVIFYQRGDPAQAVGRINLALKRSPNNVQALNNRGNALSALKQFKEALASYDRAIVSCPDFADAHSNEATRSRSCDALPTQWRPTTARSPCGRTILRRIPIAPMR
jgi:tetratricopeptide (TPR) repeat protein